jgi:hypothetical protein
VAWCHAGVPGVDSFGRMSLSGLSKECWSARCGADSGKILAAGMDDILPSPVTIDALREMIERVRMPPRAA